MSDLVFPPVLESLQRRMVGARPPLADLIAIYQPLRQELVQKRSALARKSFADQIRLNEETRAIREGGWTTEGTGLSGASYPGAQAEWLDFESDPELSGRYTLGLYQRAMTSSPTRIRTHSLLHEEREITFEGRHVPGFLMNLSLLGNQHVLVVPKLESRFEARALSEILHYWRARSGSRPRIGVEFETIQAVVEAEEILFELKEFVVLTSFDPLDYLSNLIRKMASQHETLVNPFQEEDLEKMLVPVQNHLIQLARRRDVQWVTHPSAVDLPRGEETCFFPKLPTFRKPEEEEVRRLIDEALSFLVGLLENTEIGPVKNESAEPFARFEFCRSTLWQWIHHEAISEESYFRLRGGPGRDPERRSHEMASHLLDSLLLNGNFVEFAGAYSNLHRRISTA